MQFDRHGIQSLQVVMSEEGRVKPWRPSRLTLSVLKDRGEIVSGNGFEHNMTVVNALILPGIFREL